MFIRILWVIFLIGCSQMSTHAGPSAFLEKVADGVYVHHGAHLDIDEGYQGDICNLSVIVGSKGVAVIDTGGSLKTGQQLRQAISQLTKLPVLYVINTHVHPDHIYGNAAFLADKPQFVGHEKLANAMLNRKEQYDKLNAKLLGDASETVIPTMPVKGTLELDLGDRTLKLTSQPIAHTHTDLVIMDSKTSTLFTGDLLFTERTPVLEGDIKGLIGVLEQLKKSSAKLVVPGHGKQSADVAKVLDDELHYLNLLLTDIRAGIKTGAGLEKTMDTAAQSEKDKWLLFDVANRRNVNTLYPALEWE